MTFGLAILLVVFLAIGAACFVGLRHTETATAEHIVAAFPVTLVINGAKLKLRADGTCVGDIDAFEAAMKIGQVDPGQPGAAFSAVAWLVVREVRRTGGCQPEQQSPPAP